MKISIITVAFNSQETIEETLVSVINQNYNNLEYIVIDGASRDNTTEIIKKYLDKIDYFISEPDNGMYDAINKGIELANGDVIGLLNSDDCFADTTIVTQISNAFLNNKNCEALIANISFVKNNLIIRKLISKKWRPKYFEYGMMPAHPSFYCKKELFDKYGKYRVDFEIAADFELMLRFMYINKINFIYMPINFVNMKLGGKSTKGFKSLLTINKEIYNSFILNGKKTSYIKIYLKYFFKIFEFKFFLKKAI